MAISRLNVQNAVRLADTIQDIEQALVILADPNPEIFVEVSTAQRAGVRISLPIGPSVLIRMLNQRKTTLENQLTALGVI